MRTETPVRLHFSRVAMRMPPASERLPSQRAPREERDEDAEAAELQRQLEELRGELKDVMKERNKADKRAREAERKLAEKHCGGRVSS